jgi:hypothetical protein
MVAKSWVGLAWRLHRVRGICGGSQKTVRVTWLSHKTKTGGSAGGDRIRALRSFEEGDMRHNRGACVGRTQRPNGFTTVRWRTSCVDQKAPVRAWVVTPSVGALRSFLEGLYIGGGGWILALVHVFRGSLWVLCSFALLSLGWGSHRHMLVAFSLLYHIMFASLYHRLHLYHML